MSEPVTDNSLPDDVRWRLQQADGYLDLRLPERAQREWERIPAELREALPVLELSLRLALDTRDWAEAARIARRLRDQQPNEAAYWVHLAYATRRCEGIEAAREILLQAQTRFKTEAVIPYNLACYECRLGRHAASLDLLERAIQLDQHYRALALEDDDLEPLWDRIGE